MGKKIRFLIMALALIVFGACAFIIYSARRNYRMEEEIYEKAAAEYVRPVSAEEGESSSLPDEAEGGAAGHAPIEVDFEALLAESADAVGWLYCEGTTINYPVVQGKDNTFYLHHNYSGEKQNSGAVFVDADNRTGFQDANTFVYGHYMNDGSMFAVLRSWEEEGFYQEHPVMWLLTPEQDYKVVLFAGYNTVAGSETYSIFDNPGREFEAYLRFCAGKSDFETDVVLEGAKNCIVLSTCELYTATDSRYVIHGILVPVDKPDITQD